MGVELLAVKENVANRRAARPESAKGMQSSRAGQHALRGLRSCEKMRTGTGLGFRIQAFFPGWPEPVPIFSQPLRGVLLVAGRLWSASGRAFRLVEDF